MSQSKVKATFSELYGGVWIFFRRLFCFIFRCSRPPQAVLPFNFPPVPFLFQKQMNELFVPLTDLLFKSLIRVVVIYLYMYIIFRGGGGRVNFLFFY